MNANKVGTKELMLFHNLDRRLYARLVARLCVDPNLSLKLVAFWNWLESCGFSKVVYKLLLLPDELLYSCAKSTSDCLRFLTNRVGLNPFIAIDKRIKYLPILLGTDFSHWFLHENREIALLEISEFVEDVCVRAFHDINSLVTQSVHGPELVSSKLAQLLKPITRPTSASGEISDSILSSSHSTKERTLVVSFFETHRVSKAELIDLFAWHYGVKFWTIDMKDGPENNMHLDVIFARVVLKSREEITKILKGEKYAEISLGSGRVIFVRRFVTLQEANHIHNHCQHKNQPQSNISIEIKTIMMLSH